MKRRKGLKFIPLHNELIIRLYNTDIVVIDFTNKVIKLNSSGWKTKHTKNCSNDVLEKFNLKIEQKNHTWFIRDNNTGNSYNYCDGIKYNYEEQKLVA